MKIYSEKEECVREKKVRDVENKKNIIQMQRMNEMKHGKKRKYRVRI